MAINGDKAVSESKRNHCRHYYQYSQLHIYFSARNHGLLSSHKDQFPLKNERPTWCHLLFYFTSYVLNMFRTLIYPSSGVCECFDELPHRSSCSQFVVCWRFGVAGFEWCSFCRLMHNHSKPAAPNVQHTTNWEQDDRCGNSTTQLPAPDDGYINVRNILST